MLPVSQELNMIFSSTHRMTRLGAQNLFAQFEIRYIQPRLPTDLITILTMLMIHVFVLFEKRLLKTNTLLQITYTNITKELRVLLERYINKIKLKLTNLQKFLTAKTIPY